MATFETILSMKKNSRFSYRCLVRFERRNNCGLGWPKLLSLLLYVDNARLVADVSSLWTLFTRNAWGGCAESAGTTESVTTISCNGRPRSTLLYLVLPTHFSVHACGLARCHYLYYSYWSLHLFSAGWIIATVCWGQKWYRNSLSLVVTYGWWNIWDEQQQLAVVCAMMRTSLAKKWLNLFWV